MNTRSNSGERTRDDFYLMTEPLPPGDPAGHTYAEYERFCAISAATYRWALGRPAKEVRLGNVELRRLRAMLTLTPIEPSLFGVPIVASGTESHYEVIYEYNPQRGYPFDSGTRPV